MPLIMLLPFFPLTTVMVGMFVITTVKCNKFDCMDIVQDTLECDVCWCYENGGFACCCCTVCHDNDDDDQLHDDYSQSFQSYYSK